MTILVFLLYVLAFIVITRCLLYIFCPSLSENALESDGVDIYDHIR